MMDEPTQNPDGDSLFSGTKFGDTDHRNKSDPVVPEKTRSSKVRRKGRRSPSEAHRTRDVSAPFLANELFIPIHGFVFLSEQEREILDHPALQRLAQVYQLGQAYYVYRGATHRRIEHVIGATHTVGVIAESISRNHSVLERDGQESQRRMWRLGNPLSNSELAFTRLAALLHDIGHLPAGHTLEDELGILDKHDHKKRINRIAHEKTWFGIPVHSKLSDLINHLYGPFLPPSSNCSAYDLVVSLILKPDQAPLKQTQLGENFRIQVCRDIVGNTICADLIDYLYRDWHHLGKSLPAETRLYQYMQVRYATEEVSGEKHRFVIWIGEEHNIKSDAFSAILAYLERRYELAEAVLFHRTKCMASAMLERGLLELHEQLLDDKHSDQRDELVSQLLEHSDESMLKAFQDTPDARPEVAGLFARLRSRNLFRNLFTLRYRQRSSGNEEKIRRTYGTTDTPADARRSARNRLKALRLLEEEFGLPSCSLAMYCPSKGMNSKLAKVQVYIDGGVKCLDEMEGGDDGIRDRLAAQFVRFRHLWRVQIGISREVEAMLTEDKLRALKEASKRIVLGIGDDKTITESAASITALLASDTDSPFYGKEPVKIELAARNSAPLKAKDCYPSRIERLALYFKE